MEGREQDTIIEELQERISDARNLDENDVAFALENFYEWFLDVFVR